MARTKRPPVDTESQSPHKQKQKLKQKQKQKKKKGRKKKSIDDEVASLVESSESKEVNSREVDSDWEIANGTSDSSDDDANSNEESADDNVEDERVELLGPPVKNKHLQHLHKFYMKHKNTDMRALFSPDFDHIHRQDVWASQFGFVRESILKYGWTVPDDRALRILKHFSPLVFASSDPNECWCDLLWKHDIDVIKVASTDVETFAATAKNPKIITGGPKILQTIGGERTLVLCHPCGNELFSRHASHAAAKTGSKEKVDPFQSFGASCLENYSGIHVIHIGEFFGGTNINMGQAPWGASTSSALQQRLLMAYHCILEAGLPNWLHTSNTISAWKRSRPCTMGFSVKTEQGVEVYECAYRHVPLEERLPSDIAAPCIEHLLQNDNAKTISGHDAKPRKKVCYYYDPTISGSSR